VSVTLFVIFSYQLLALHSNVKRPLFAVGVSTCVSCVCASVRISATLMLNISETKQFMGSCPIAAYRKVPYSASISDIIGDVTWKNDVRLVQSQYSKSLHS